MPERKDIPSLVAAATALDDELRAFDEIARQAKDQRMNSQKTLTRTAAILTESVTARDRIEAGVRRLVAEIGQAQQRQEASVQVLVAAAAELEQRTKNRETLLARFAGLGASAARVNTMAADLATRRNEGAAESEILELLREIEGHMSQVAAEADELTATAEKDGWPDIARQGDAVRQQINAAKSKLATARRSVASGAPS